MYCVYRVARSSKTTNTTWLCGWALYQANNMWIWTKKATRNTWLMCHKHVSIYNKSSQHLPPFRKKTNDTINLIEFLWLGDRIGTKKMNICVCVWSRTRWVSADMNMQFLIIFCLLLAWYANELSEPMHLNWITCVLGVHIPRLSGYTVNVNCWIKR